MSANLVSVAGLTKSFPERQVLRDVSFGIDDRDRLGLIGLNGSGKSTLLGLVAGAIQPDEGTIVTRSGLVTAYLEQNPDFAEHATVEDVASKSHGTLAYLDRLGITDLDRRLASLSGGQRRRVALAAALAIPSDLLILDEPTNHLDIDVIDWLEEELARRSQTVMFVTHDRYLLDRLANRIMEIDQRRIHHHTGDYQEYLAARDERRSHEERTDRKRANLATTELEWLRRSPKARTSKSKSRIERATNLQISNLSEQSTGIEFELPTRRLGDKVVDVEDASVAFDSNVVLSKITWRLASGSRVGIVGPNGSGKTTLLRLLGGRLEPTGGSVAVGSTVSPGWYGQDPEPLDPTKRLVDVIRGEAEQTKLTSGIVVSASQLLERFGFGSSQHSSTVGDLSGGERRRLELLRVLVSAPNLLLLDEPTNDLDLETLGSLEAQLDDWPGAVVTATHDRYFLDRVCRDVISVEPDGSLRHHPGGYSAYLKHRARSETPDRVGSSRESQVETASNSGRRLSYNEQRELRSAAAQIDQLSKQIVDVDGQLAETGDDWQRLSHLSADRERLTSDLDRLESRWLELTEQAGGSG